MIKSNIAKLTMSALVVSLVAGCQSVPKNKLTAPVIPKIDNTFETTGSGKSKKEALADGMHNVNVTCAQQTEELRPAVVKHDVKYLGVLNEKTGVLIDKVGDVLGSVAGRDVPSVNSKTDYEATITFKCVQ